MGARGPKPKGGYGEKTRVLSTRITAPTREALEQASAMSGLSISSEVESRLRRSFIEDDKIVDALGGRQVFGIVKLIASTMTTVGQHAYFHEHRKIAGEADWLGDPVAYDQAVKATVTVLEALRPPGDTEQKREVVISQAVGIDAQEAKRLSEEVFKNLGVLVARGNLHEVATAEPTEPEPTSKTSKKKRTARRIAADLGPLRDNLKKGPKQ